MIDLQDISKAKTKIKDRFLDVCLNGAQTRKVQSVIDVQLLKGGNNIEGVQKGKDVIACGQFIDDQTRQQHGLHGIASAINVLCNADDQKSQQSVQRLLNYLSFRLNSNFYPDKLNSTIKISELLISISKIKDNPNLKSKLHDVFVEKLINGKNTKGLSCTWDYYLDTSENSNVYIPTSYAAMALSSVNALPKECDVFDGLKSEIEKYVRSQDYKTHDYSERILILYTLVFFNINNDKELMKLYRKALTKIWKETRNLFTNDIEQNLEYWRNNENKYIRIPWQLYLITISVKLEPIPIYSTYNIQNRLEKIIDLSLSSGFKYPHSGTNLSSRTNSILYTTLEKIEVEIKDSRIGFLYNFFGTVSKWKALSKSFFNHWITAFIGYVIGGSIISLSIILGLINDLAIEDLATEFLGAIVIIMLTRNIRY
ncbi:MAG: hypothetical protein RLN90_14895 [Balneolaceae bacterium]